MELIMASGASVDQQVAEGVSHLRNHHPEAYQTILKDFPEAADIKFDMAQFDTEAMGVDVEFSSWLADALEATGLVHWEEGDLYGEFS